MTSKGGKNKEVHYELQASSVTNVVTMFGHLLCVITVHNHGQMESTCFIHFFFIIGYSEQNWHVFWKLRSDGLREVHYVIRVSLIQTSQDLSARRVRKAKWILMKEAAPMTTHDKVKQSTLAIDILRITIKLCSPFCQDWWLRDNLIEWFTFLVISYDDEFRFVEREVCPLRRSAQVA